MTRTSAQGATEEARYRYDALGRRISKTVHHANGTTATTHYGWDGDRLVHEAKERHQTTVVYEPGSFVPMLRIDQASHDAPKQISAYITDALGTPMQLVTPRGDTLWQAQPDDWAAVTNEQGRTAQPIRFQGQWHDDESGLYYNRHRYYDPQQGRYISQDPIGLNGGTNLYGYVSNPTGMVDPLGLTPAAACAIPGPTMAACASAGQWLLGVLGIGAAATAVSTISGSTNDTSQARPGAYAGTHSSTAEIMHRGRIQAQGGGLEASVSWAQMSPPSSADGLLMLEELQAQLTKRQVRERAIGFSQAERFINNAGNAGGVMALFLEAFHEVVLFMLI